jgi:DNA-binding CsgD family transcriptional regulator
MTAAAQRQTRYTVADVEQIAAKLRSMPDPPAAQQPVSKAEAIRLLRAEIANLQKRGYTLEQIAESISGAGLDINGNTLRNYMTRAKPKARNRPKAEASPAPAPPATPGGFTPAPDSEDI